MTDTPEPVSAEPAAAQATPEPTLEPSPTSSEFSLPDEYKDKPWADKVKSNDDLYKQVDNLTTLVGKKTVAPIDYATASSEEIAAHHASLAPEDVSEYGLSQEEDSKDFSDFLGDTYKEAGLTPYQAKILNEKVTAKTVEMQDAKTAAETDGEAYVKMLDESFGEGKGADVGKKIDAQIKEYAANEEDVALLRDGIPNTTRLALDRVLNNILDKHGVKESGAQVDGGDGKVAVTNIEDTRKDLRQQIRDLDGTPFSGDKSLELKNQLAKTYT